MQDHLRGKLIRMIYALPDEPVKPIYWIVYNEDMIAFTDRLIREIKGSSYPITVVAKGEDTRNLESGQIYFDPGLYDLLGNGNS